MILRLDGSAGEGWREELFARPSKSFLSLVDKSFTLSDYTYPCLFLWGGIKYKKGQENNK